MSDEIDDLNIAAEDLTQTFIDMHRRGDITDDTLKKLGVTIKKAGVRAEDWGNAVNKSTNGLKSMTSQVANGGNAFTSITPIIESMGDAIGGLVSSLPFAEGITKAFTATMVFAVKRLEVSYKAFQDVGEAGMLGAEGMTGLRKQMVEAQVPMERFSKMLSKNSENLAYFSGTSAKGAKTFAAVMGSMQKGEQQHLRNLGFSLEEIGDTISGFQKNQRRLGYEQFLTTTQLKDASVKYGKELDMIARLTGKQRSAIEQERETLMADSQFRAFLDGLPNMTAEAKRKMIDSINTLPQELRVGAKQYIASGGAFQEESIQMVLQGWQPTLEDMRRGLQQGTVSAIDFKNSMSKTADENLATFRRLNQLGQAVPGPMYAAMADLANWHRLTKEEQDAVKANQAKQAVAPDKLAAETVKASLAINAMQVTMDDLTGRTGAASSAVGMFATAMTKVTDMINDKILGDGSGDPSNKTPAKLLIKAKENLAQSKVDHAKTEGSFGQFLSGATVDANQRRVDRFTQEKKYAETKQIAARKRQEYAPISGNRADLEEMQRTARAELSELKTEARSETGPEGRKFSAQELGDVQAMSQYLRDIAQSMKQLNNQTDEVVDGVKKAATAAENNR